MSNFMRSVFYIGVTDNIVRRTIEHASGIGSAFTTRYHLKYLLYFETYQYVQEAIAREKEIKRWRREKKLSLIRSVNQDLRALNDQLFRDYGLTTEDVAGIASELRQRYSNRFLAHPDYGVRSK